MPQVIDVSERTLGELGTMDMRRCTADDEAKTLRTSGVVRCRTESGTNAEKSNG